LGYSALQAGLGFIPLAVTMMISSPASARLDARFGSKAVVVAGLIIAAGAVALLSTASVDSSYGLVAAVLALLGIGLGCVMTPATNSIMGSLPLAKAGVGSAVNDTTRQIGGALGVAILGSITNVVYRSTVQSSASFKALAATARATVRGGIGNALVTAGSLPSAARSQLALDAKRSFVHAMDLTALIGTLFVLAGALVAYIWLPARAADEPAPVESVELAAAAS
ncbi:MAG TPA: MFS transporter, partial [Acidimicrobiales bacterium]